METKSNFKTLLENNFCFAVVIAIVISKVKGIDWNSKEHFMLLSKNAIAGLKDHKINAVKCKEYPELIEVNMSEEDIERFKQNQDKFTKVLQNEEGRVYELKSRPFKELIFINLNNQTNATH